MVKELTPEEFEDKCTEFRAAKIQEKKTKKVLGNLRQPILRYAQKNAVKGNIHGISVTDRYSFLPSNEQIAIYADLEVPYTTTIELLGEVTDKLNQTLTDAGIKFVVNTNVAMDALKKLMAKAKVDAEYGLSYALGLSTED